MRMSLSQFPICIISPRSKKINRIIWCLILCEMCTFFSLCRLQFRYLPSLSVSTFFSFHYLFFFLFLFYIIFSLKHFFLDITRFPQDRLDTEINILHMNSYV